MLFVSNGGSIIVINIPYALYITNMTNQIYFVYILRVKKKFPTFETRRKLCPLFLRDSGASETRARVKITPREKGEHAAGREKNEGLQKKPKLLHLCVALTTQNSDWLVHGNLSTFLKTRQLFTRNSREQN